MMHATRITKAGAATRPGKGTILRRILAGILMVAGCAATSGAQVPEGIRGSDTVPKTAIDWISGSLSLDWTFPVDREGGNRLSAGSRTEAQEKPFLIARIPLALEFLRVDSRTTLKDISAQNGGFLQEFATSLATNPPVYQSYLSGDLKSLLVHTAVGFRQLRELLSRPGRDNTPLERIFGWQPARNYTGVIVYMKGLFPLYGTAEKCQPEPALFIRLHDTDGRTVFSRDNMDTEAEIVVGTHGYAKSVELARMDPRVGSAPLIIGARGVFGMHPVDPVISREDANLLLYNESTRQALCDGRLIVVMDFP